MWKRLPLLLLFACSPDVLVNRTSGTIALDAPLEFQFAEDVDASALDGLELRHDGVRETGKVTVEANIARFWPDHGWYAGTTYEASLDGVEDEAGGAIPPWTFASHGSWRELDDVAPDGCGANDWSPRTTTTLDGALWLVSLAQSRTCLARRTAGGWERATLLGTAAPAGGTLFQGTLHLAEDGKGFVIHRTNVRTEIIDVGGTVLGQIDGLDNFARTPIAAMSRAGRGLVAWKTDASIPADHKLFVRRYETGALAEPTMVAQGDLNMIGVAASDAGVRAVAWSIRDAANATHLWIAIDRGDGAWQAHEVRTVAINAFGGGQLAVDEAGWVYLAWLETAGTTMQVWAAAASADARQPAARIDGNSARALRSDLALASSWGHTRVAWLEKPEQNRLGVAVTRPASGGVWAAIEESTADVEPYLDLAMALDSFGNLAFTWKDGQLTPCGARKIGGVWSELCGLPSPGFTAPTPGISVNARGRAFVSFYTGEAVGVATFD